MYHTIDSATQVETPELLGAGDALGVDNFYEMEDETSKKVLDPWLYLDGISLTAGYLVWCEFFKKSFR